MFAATSAPTERLAKTATVESKRIQVRRQIFIIWRDATDTSEEKESYTRVLVSNSSGRSAEETGSTRDSIRSGRRNIFRRLGIVKYSKGIPIAVAGDELI